MNDKQINRDFGYTDPRDIEWAKTCKKGKSGLPYGTSPSSQAEWDAAQAERDRPALIGIVVMVIAALVFTLYVNLAPYVFKVFGL